MRANGFAPIVRDDARVLILGSLPGISSLQQQQYYAHPQNSFWRIQQSLFNIPAQASYIERCEQLMKNHIALWDVCQSAQRAGSLDNAINTSSVIANDIAGLLQSCMHIELIALNGNAALQLFKRHIPLHRPIGLLALPSTSPAHARLRFEEKLALWQKIKL